MPEISVIVPAYNAEKTLKKTVEDLLDQTYADFEIVIVDDGSTDKTAAICDDLAMCDKRIHVIHQNNGGLSNARNNGTKAAKGRYVSYVDSDDRIDRKYLDYLVRAVRKTGADFVCGQIDRAREGQESFEEAKPFNVEEYNVKQALQKMGTGLLSVGSCCKLSLRSHYLTHPFLEGKLHEDLSNTYKIIMDSSKIAIIDVILYHYVMRGGSITGRKQTTKKQCLDQSEAIELCFNDVVKQYPELRDSMTVLKIKDLLSLYLTVNRCTEKDAALESIQKAAVDWIYCNWKIVTKNTEVAHELRLRTILFILSPKLYEKLYYIGIVVKGKRIS